MNSRPRPRVRPDLIWIHEGVRHRATVWPDVGFECESALAEWESCEPSEAALASAALGVSQTAWREYLEFVPTEVRAFLEQFHFARMVALHVITRCPTLFAELGNVPALTPYLAAHLGLRGGSRPCWSEIAAVYEREGVFGVLQWLGLPASRQTLAVLRNVAEPDLPRRLIEPLRAALWEPETIWGLTHAQRLTDARIAAACHALAA